MSIFVAPRPKVARKNKIERSTKYRKRARSSGIFKLAEWTGCFRTSTEGQVRSARCQLVEGVEKFGGLGEGGIGVADGFGVHGLERLFGGDAIEPALMGEFFVVGEVEAD